MEIIQTKSIAENPLLHMTHRLTLIYTVCLPHKELGSAQGFHFKDFSSEIIKTGS